LLISPQQFDFLLPFACKWAEAQQERILRDSEQKAEAAVGSTVGCDDTEARFFG
jgi:hypothetical protein